VAGDLSYDTFGAMGKINAEWHNANKMPRNPTREQRLDWHLRHSEACTCREIPPGLKAEVEAYRLARKA
jgi:hypothetical protein